MAIWHWIAAGIAAAQLATFIGVGLWFVLDGRQSERRQRSRQHEYGD